MLTKISDFWKNAQLYLFPIVEEQTGPIGATHRKLTAILELIQIEKFVQRDLQTIGRPPKDRVALARAFVAKVVFKFKYTSQLRDYLLSDKQLRIICGWESFRKIPSPSKFSRAFNEFAKSKLPERVHQELIKTTYDDQIVGHLTIDSTPVEAREKEVKVAPSNMKKKAGKPGRPKKGEKREKQFTRSQKQASGIFSLNEMIADLPTDCTIAMKKKPGLSNYVWKGYKLHLGVDDAGVPLVALVTSASLNDHEAAIPITLLARQRFSFFYQLMDSAYDVKAVLEYISSLGQVPIVDKKSYNPAQKAEKIAERKRRKILNWRPAEAIRYRERMKGERPNALIKEYYGANNIQYKGHLKVSCHLMFGVLTLAASLLLGPG